VPILALVILVPALEVGFEALEVGFLLAHPAFGHGQILSAEFESVLQVEVVGLQQRGLTGLDGIALVNVKSGQRRLEPSRYQGHVLRLDVALDHDALLEGPPHHRRGHHRHPADSGLSAGGPRRTGREGDAAKQTGQDQYRALHQQASLNQSRIR
jgi:hypothetical protein